MCGGGAGFLYKPRGGSVYMCICVISSLSIFLSLGGVFFYLRVGSIFCIHVCVLDWLFLCLRMFLSIHFICA